MGKPKALLDWHGVPLVAHVAAVLVEAVEPGAVVVVRAAGQPLPSLRGVEVIDDTVVERGPLQGLRDGLAALRGRADATFLSGTDAPFLHPRFVRVVLDALDESHDAAVPETDGRLHPLSAAYSVSLLPLVERLLAGGERRVQAVGRHCRMLTLNEVRLRGDPTLARLDPGLRALWNLNTPADYAAALREPSV
jgi:molybdopterin-guanine dinucleotide biosynthesis protein A